MLVGLCKWSGTKLYMSHAFCKSTMTISFFIIYSHVLFPMSSLNQRATSPHYQSQHFGSIGKLQINNYFFVGLNEDELISTNDISQVVCKLQKITDSTKGNIILILAIYNLIMVPQNYDQVITRIRLRDYMQLVDVRVNKFHNKWYNILVLAVCSHFENASFGKCRDWKIGIRKSFGIGELRTIFNRRYGYILMPHE